MYSLHLSIGKVNLRKCWIFDSYTFTFFAIFHHFNISFMTNWRILKVAHILDLSILWSYSLNSDLKIRSIKIFLWIFLYISIFLACIHFSFFVFFLRVNFITLSKSLFYLQDCLKLIFLIFSMLFLLILII